VTETEPPTQPAPGGENQPAEAVVAQPEHLEVPERAGDPYAVKDALWVVRSTEYVDVGKPLTTSMFDGSKEDLRRDWSLARSTLGAEAEDKVKREAIGKKAAELIDDLRKAAREGDDAGTATAPGDVETQATPSVIRQWLGRLAGRGSVALNRS
jgi:hypothetical protein